MHLRAYTITLQIALTILSLVSVAKAQNNPLALNGYKYLYLAPLKYKDGANDRWGIRSAVEAQLLSCGIQLINPAAPPTDAVGDPCLVATCFVEHTNNMGKDIADILYLKFTNCEEVEFLRTRGSTGALVWNYQQGWRKATKEALKPLVTYQHLFEPKLSVQYVASLKFPPVEKTSETEESMRSYFTSTKIETVEGIYQSHGNDGLGNYRLGLKKMGEIYKLVVLSSDKTGWQIGDVKAYMYPTAEPKLYSIKWLMGNKEPYNTIARLENGSTLIVKFEGDSPQNDRESAFLKMFPIRTDRVENGGSNSEKYTGTAFAVTVGGLLATNAHVIEGKDKISVSILTNEGVKTYKAKVKLKDPSNDVALLQIEDNLFKSFPKIPYRLDDRTEIGEGVFTIGFPLNQVMGTNYKVTDGIVSAKTGIDDDIRYYQISVPLQPGNSGGPLFDSKGNVIGITTGKLNGVRNGTRAENVGYAIKSIYLSNLLRMLPSPPKFPQGPLSTEKSIAVHVKNLKFFVVLVTAE